MGSVVKQEEDARTEPRDGEARAAEQAAEDAAIALARLASAGDSQATAKLLRRLAPRLSRVVRAVLGAAHPDVEDAIQQSLIGFVHALPAFRGDCDPMGYATVIAVRTAVAARKRSRTERTRRDEGVEPDVLVEPRPSPSDEATSARRKEVLRELLAELPAEQAEALASRVVLGWSLEEIAARSGAPLNTVRSRLRLAKEALKRKIEADSTLLEELEVRT
jgi:RNA polymerase sigma-70 factor (ECF subfamily)